MADSYNQEAIQEILAIATALAVTHQSPEAMRYAALTHPAQELQVI